MNDKEFVAVSESSLNAKKIADKFALSDSPVFITGETGTGKEIFADYIHKKSSRAAYPLLKINCAALPLELIESELFGALRGSYTGSYEDREGLLRLAGDGSVLLDELSEMPISVQSKLLRALQEKKVRPLGGDVFYPISCRIMASTNIPASTAISNGKLRSDLYYRLSVLSLHLTPLRERREDIAALAKIFFERAKKAEKKDNLQMSSELLEQISSYDWPGNVRQLQNEINRAVVIAEKNQLDFEHFSTDLKALSGFTKASEQLGLDLDLSIDLSHPLTLEEIKKRVVFASLARNGWNKIKSAQELDIGRQTLYNMMDRFNLRRKISCYTESKSPEMAKFVENVQAHESENE